MEDEERIVLILNISTRKSILGLIRGASLGFTLKDFTVLNRTNIIKDKMCNQNSEFDENQITKSDSVKSFSNFSL